MMMMVGILTVHIKWTLCSGVYINLSPLQLSHIGAILMSTALDSPSQWPQQENTVLELMWASPILKMDHVLLDGA